MQYKNEISLSAITYIIFLIFLTLLLCFLFGCFTMFSFGFMKETSSNNKNNNIVNVENSETTTTTMTITTSTSETTSTKKNTKKTTKKTTQKIEETIDESQNMSFSDNNINEVFANDLIVSEFEKDQKVIKEVFSKGMDTYLFNEILNKRSSYIDSSNDYSFINYDFEKKLSYKEIENFLFMLNNSNIVKLENVGVSLDNRNIYSVEIGNGSKKAIIDANIHASEVGTTYIIMKYMIDLVNKYEQGDNEVIELLNNMKIIFVPSINPDGYEVYNFGIDSIVNKDLWIYKNKNSIDFNSFKFNANGVDINRNMPTQNGGLYYNNKNLLRSVSKSLTTKKGIYFSGNKLGSEKETQALMYVILKHYKDAVFYINMHSQGRVIYHSKPNLNTNFNNLSGVLANKIKQYTTYVPLGSAYEEVGQGNDGTATDFVAELANGFKFSNVTGRLTNQSSYLNSSVNLKYDCAVVTLETLTTIIKDVNEYKNEYYNKNFYYMFNALFNDYI